MPIVEHQYLHYKNVLCFEMQLDYGEIEDFAQRIDYSLDILDLSRDGKIVITQKLVNLIPELNKLYHIDFKLNLFDYMDANGEMQSVRFKRISYINTPTPQSDNMISIEMQSSGIGKIAEEVCIYHYDKALYDIYGARWF